MTSSSSLTLSPIDALRTTRAYSVPRSITPTDLRLDGNEGVALPEALLDELSGLDAHILRDYPKPYALDEAIAARIGLPATQVLATAGADDALDRTCRAMLCAGRTILLTDPTFEMISRYAALTGADITPISWPDGAPFPTQDFLDRITPETRHIALVSPNNPSGQVIPAKALDAIALAAPQALVLVDHAYVEFADAAFDLSEVARGYSNVVVARTLSKAWGLAGLRVGYITGAEEVITWLRASGNPYALTGPSIALTIARLQRDTRDIDEYIKLTHATRPRINVALMRSGATPTPSQANFCFARHPNPAWVRDVMAALGVSLRIWPGHPTLADALRISCPNSNALTHRTLGSLQVLCPEAILFDMDGVLVDVSKSYRAAIIATAAHFGVSVTGTQIQHAKHLGHANNDWVLTQSLLANEGVIATLDEVTLVFEELYQGTDNKEGLKHTERVTVTRHDLALCKERARLAVVTGRPRRDALEFLEREGFADLFEVIICMEDAPAKPSAEPVALAMDRLGVKTAWMIGDTPDDVRAARHATQAHQDLFVAPFGVLPPGEQNPDATRHALDVSGAGRTFSHTNDFLDLIKLLPISPGGSS